MGLFRVPAGGERSDRRLRQDLPLLDNLRLCAVPAGLRLHDLVLNRALTASGDPIVSSATAGLMGPAVVATATTQFWHWGAEGTAVRLPTTMCTIALLRRRADTTIRDAAFCGSSNAGNATRLMLSTFVDNNIYWDFGGVAGANRISVTTTGNITTNLEAWVAVAGTRGSALYRNGLRLASQTTAITRTASTATMQVPGAANGSTGSDPQEVYQFLLLEQEWTPTQVQEWTAAPESIFGAPRRLIVQIPSSGTSAGRLINRPPLTSLVDGGLAA